MSSILLVHGSWHGPWCWDGFAERLTERAHDVRAVQLRGHDQRPGRIWHRLRDYVEDVERAAAEFPESPVLVGQSMGGMVVQRCLERRDVASGAVLMASVPPGGAAPAAARLAARHPVAMAKVNLTWSLRPLVASRALARELFFAPETPSAIVEDCMARLQDESYPAFVDLMLALGRRRRARVPVLVLGAEADGVFTVREVGRTARAYGTEAEIFPIGHDMMLDTGWERVADRVDGWVRALEPEAAPAPDGSAGRRGP